MFVFLYRRRIILNFTLRILIEYLIACSICAFVLSRILFVIALIPSGIIESFADIIHYLINGGLVFYGGLFGVMFGIFVVCKFRRRDYSQIINIITPAFPLFHIFGRLGCLLAGCCYGIECTWGVIMHSEPSIIRFPVQFIESLGNIIIFVMLLLVELKFQTHKHNLKVYLISYSLFRFVLEFYRADIIRGIWFGGLSTAQCISLIILIICVFPYIKKLCRRKA